MTGNDVSIKSIHLKNGREWSLFVGLMKGILAGVVIALVFSVVCWFLVDAVISTTGPSFLSANFATKTGQFSLLHFLGVIDNCGLTYTVVYRIDVITFAAVVVAFVTGNWIRKSVIENERPRVRAMLKFTFAMAAIVILTTAALAIYLPPANSSESEHCLSDRRMSDF
jgi:ABC-type uncharacterized transport system permease subunit